MFPFLPFCLKMKSLQFSLFMKQFPAPNGTIDKKKAKYVYHGEKNVSSSQIKKKILKKKLNF